jgi:hypothetical protein
MDTNSSFQDFRATVQALELILIVITNLVDKLDMHTTQDIKDIVLYTLRKVDEVIHKLKYGFTTPRS